MKRVPVLLVATAMVVGVASLAKPAAARGDYQRDISATIPLDGATAIDIRTSNADLTTKFATDRRQSNGPAASNAVPAGNTIAIHGTAHADSQAVLDDVGVTVERRGGNLVVQIGPRHDRGSNFSGSFTLGLPSDSPVAIETSNGNVHVAGHRAPLHVTTSNGNVNLDDSAAATTIRTSNGAIDIARAAGSLDLESSNGTITTSLAPTWHGTIAARTTNATIDLSVPHASKATLHTSTSNGDVQNIARLQMAGDDATIRLQSSNGNIVVR